MNKRDFTKGLVKPKFTKFKGLDRNIVLGNSQEKALTDFDYWFKNDLSSVYTLSGRAGVGKTFLLHPIIRNVLKGKRVAVSAPTHKAVKVIEDFTKVKGFTIHSIHGLRPNFNLSDVRVDNLRFDPTGISKFGRYHLIIIDEASMIGAGLHKLNMIRAQQFGTKILYVGDKLQLLPVKEATISKAFDSEYGFELDEIIRQKMGNKLIELLTILRGDIVSNSSQFLNYIKNTKIGLKNNIGFEVLNAYQFTNQVDDAFKSDDFANDINAYRIGAYTNKKIQLWNQHIRRLLIKSDELIAVGDRLMGYKTIVDEYLTKIIINSNDYIVVQCESITSDDGFKMFELKLKDYSTNHVRDVYIVDHTDKSFNKYYNKLCLLHRSARYAKIIEKRSYWKAYYYYKDTFMCMIDFPLIYDNKEHAKLKREIDYAYAITVHKLQGSTIKNIMLDTMDICYYNSNSKTPRVNTKWDKSVINNRNRLLYTGLSRASDKGIILNY